jgi:hypothetical protein
MPSTKPGGEFICGITTCGAEEAAHVQLWWTDCHATDAPGRVPALTDHLRRWSSMLIDAILDFHNNMKALGGPHGHEWQQQMLLATEECLQPVTHGLPAHHWLVHARHRTQTRTSPSRDRRLFKAWTPHLVAAARDLIGQSGAAAAQVVRSGNDQVTATHLLRARHALLHACSRLLQATN